MSGPSAREGRVARGRAAEEAACAELQRLGYRIVDRNVRLAGAEIDIVAHEDETVVFVEVRSRSSRRLGGPLETIGRGKQTRIARAAALYLAQRHGRPVAARFDVIGIDWREGRAQSTLVRNAFDSPLS